jgi:prepilin-type N-terminal cleavage/methylation domain-containing protein
MNQKAFTLIELLVAIAIVGILAGFVFVQLNNANGAALDAKKKTGVDAIRKAILFYDVEEGRYPIENNPCTVGVDCENLDDLESLPKIPSNLTYTYQSDGTDCTISITLSTGYAYQYDCLNNSYQTNAPIVGSCGSANGFSFYTAPTENLCSSGTASPISGSGPWSWNCTGAYTGGDASCTASLKVDGACGNRAATYPYTQSDWTTSTSYCSTGTESDSPSFPNLGYSVSWSCSGSNGGIDANNCTATRQDYPSPCISGGGLTCVETADGLYFVDTYTYSASRENILGPLLAE